MVDRDEIERRIARLFGRLGQQHLNRIIEALGDPPNLANIPASLWDDIAAELTGALRPALEETYLSAAEEMLGATPIGVDWALVNEAAMSWARQYGFDLVRDVTARNRQVLQTAVGDFFQQPTTIADLRDSLMPLFGPVRAASIAGTEVTRASVQGENAVAAELEKQGVFFDEYWETSNDAIVRKCPICWPRHNKKRGDGWTEDPPAHPNCRCRKRRKMRRSV